MDIFEYSEQARNGSISIVERTRKFIEEAERKNSEFNFFNLIDEAAAIRQATELEKKAKAGKGKGKLFGVPVSVKDCICVKGMESTASSRILKGYIPLFDATVVEKARQEGAIIVGKTVQDEFGFGTFSTNVGNGKIPLNPFDKKRSCGGSSGGSAGITSSISMPHVSLAESTGGSIAAPASFCGVAGITPTYGKVSRNGLIDYANSLDKIGAMGKTVKEAAFLLEVISGKDEKDSTSLDSENGIVPQKFSLARKKIGVVREFFGSGIDKNVATIVRKKISEMEKEGAKIEEISLPLNAEYGLSVYYLIAVSEASTNLARYSGMRYGASAELKGTFDEYFSKVRTENFGKEAKRRILLGTFARMSGFRDAYYLRAMKARTLLINEYKKAFKKFDVLVHPSMPIAAPEFSEIEKLSPLQNYAMDLCTVPANLGGFPHISLNAGFTGKMPVGIMFTSDHLQEKTMLEIAAGAENL